MDYYELKFLIKPKKPGNEIMISKLAELGFESFMEDGDYLLAYAEKNNYEKAKMEVSKLHFENIEYTVDQQLIPSQNWNETWEKDFKPVIIDNSLVIKAPFHELEKPYDITIIIQPQMSFGTGHHNTTSLLASEMLSFNFTGKKVLDVGTGTGVLAILAERLGASKIIGTEIDEGSYENALENIDRNQTKYIKLYKKDINEVDHDEFDIIIANINKNVLIKHFPFYAKKAKIGGELWMSGFFESDIDDLVQVAKINGFKLIASRAKDSWAIVKLLKN